MSASIGVQYKLIALDSNCLYIWAFVTQDIGSSLLWKSSISQTLSFQHLKKKKNVFGF